METPLDKVEPYRLFKETLLSTLNNARLIFALLLTRALQNFSRNSPCFTRTLRRSLTQTNSKSCKLSSYKLTPTLLQLKLSQLRRPRKTRPTELVTEHLFLVSSF